VRFWQGMILTEGSFKQGDACFKRQRYKLVDIFFVANCLGQVLNSKIKVCQNIIYYGTPGIPRFIYISIQFIQTFTIPWHIAIFSKFIVIKVGAEKTAFSSPPVFLLI